MRFGLKDGRPARMRAGLLLGMMAASLVAVSAAPVRADDDDPLNPSWSDSLGKSIKNSMGGATKALGFDKPPPPPAAEAPSGCPTIAILDGTAAQRVMAPGATDNQGLRYQYSLFNVGRECSISGGRVSVKVGADGRVLLGPAGSAGHFDVPIRVVVFSEVDQKPVASKLYRVPASVGSGQDATPFQFVSDNLVVPVGAGRTARDYSIKVGLDTKGAVDIAKPGKARHRRKKDVESASQ